MSRLRFLVLDDRANQVVHRLPREGEGVTPYYEQDGVTIYNGDCLDVLPTLPPVAHVICDPPYEADAHSKGRRVKREGMMPLDKWAYIDKRGTPMYEHLPFPPITEDERAAASFEFGRVAQRWVLVFCQAESAHLWESALVAGGLCRRRWCVWVKPDGQPQFSGDRPGMGYETIVACHAAGKSRWNGGGTLGVFSYAKADGNHQTGHPTTKPERLMCELVSKFTDPGETILDPFMGSGTTLVAAKRLGRKAIGIEINEKYCAIAAKRLEQSALDFTSNSDIIRHAKMDASQRTFLDKGSPV